MENFIRDLENKLDELNDASNYQFMESDFYTKQEAKIEILEEIIQLANKYK